MSRSVVLSAVVLAVSLLLPGYQAAHAQAQADVEVCYQDDRGRIVKRRRPGYRQVECPPPDTPTIPDRPPVSADGQMPSDDVTAEFARRRNAVSPVPSFTGRLSSDECIEKRNCLNSYVVAAMPDRWRIIDSLPGYETRWYDPYNRNFVKADKPIGNSEWFFNFSLISDTFFELREIPTPVGNSSSKRPGSIDVFGSHDQWFVNENLAMEFVLYEGDTVFRPPDYEFRLIPVFNVNYTEIDEVGILNVNPGKGETRTDRFIGFQAAFFDKHLRNVGERYDFDSIRLGIQPFNNDFRGFLFQDNQLGIRLFGTRNNNIFQYNLAYFRRLEKDTNSGLNEIGSKLRSDDVYVANLFWQDMPMLGFISQFSVLYNTNNEDNRFYFDDNGFIQRPASLGKERPRDYDVVYLGYSADGHIGRLNLTLSAYYALGETDPGVFENGSIDVNAGFFAAEVGFDMDWFRYRFSFLYASGDDDPFDDKATGFDAVFENPQFAGADTSYWIRQSIPLIGGGRVALSTRNGVLADLRSSKEEGQSNFSNPGIWLAGFGGDADLTPELRLSFNYNYLRFDDTAVLEVARNQGPIDEEIGHDVSLSLIYRPLMSQNIVVRAAYAQLIAGDGFRDLFPDDDSAYLMFNALFVY